MRTLGHDAARPTSGFDYLRLALASMVLGWHCIAITAPLTPGQHNNTFVAQTIWDSFRAPFTLMVPGFFIVSGFLVTASLLRNRISAYLVFRALRVLPALAAVVLLSALVIGPITTSLPLSAYFVAPQFRTYFGNMVGLTQPYLPGVFVNNPINFTVNGSLWTIAFELLSYVLLALLSFAGLQHRPRLCLLLAFLASLIVPLVEWRQTFLDPWGLDGPMLMVCFFAGATIYLNRDIIPCNLPTFGVSAVLALTVLSTKYFHDFAIWPLAYSIVWLGLRNPPKTWIVSSGDYSYGIYLLNFPVGQLLWWSGLGRSLGANMFETLLLVGFGAFASWRMIESRALRLKKPLANWASSLANKIGSQVTLPPAVE